MKQRTVTIRPEMLQNKLLAWWKNNRRIFPWRNTQDPYAILVSEIFLHRTKAEQVVPVYDEFIREFPSIERLANANPRQVTKLLHPLGLFWRNRLLVPLARHVNSDYDGKIPSSTSELESLPGISKYIAAAVRCFAFGRTEPLLDTNTVRILGRMFCMTVSDSSRRSADFSELYRSLIKTDDPRSFNYAMIDLGALVCSPRNPHCEICPVNELCIYGLSRIGEKK